MDEKQRRLALAREKWNQKKKELKALKEAQEAQMKAQEQAPKEPKQEPEEPKQELEEPKQEPFIDYESKISTLVKEINELKKTKSRKLKKIEYYGSDDEKVLPSEPQTPITKPKVKQTEEPKQEQPKQQVKPKVEVKNFFGRFI